MIVRSATELGHLARDRRRELALTQAELAGRVGVSRKWIIDLEAGKRTADLSLVLRTLNVLGMEIDVRAPSTGPGASVVDDVVRASRRPR